MIRVLFICILALSPLRASAEPVIVFAAASLKDALDEIVAGYDGEVVVSYGGSGAMAQQIVQGAPADIFVSANVEWADWLAGQGIDSDRVDLLSNRLVWIVSTEIPGPSGDPVEWLANTGMIAIGQTDSVPVGIYARQSLEATGQWQDLQERLIEFPSASAVLRAVEIGEVPFGIVYETDVQGSDTSRIAANFDAQTHDAIVYPMLLLTPSGDPFFAHMQSALAADVFREHGFIVLADE